MSVFAKLKVMQEKTLERDVYDVSQEFLNQGMVVRDIRVTPMQYCGKTAVVFLVEPLPVNNHPSDEELSK